REQGKIQAKKQRDGIINLTNRIRKLQSSPSPNTHNIAKTTRKLKALEETASKAYAIQSRVCWYEEGESSSMYFYQQFKQKQQKASISSLQIPTTIPPQIPSMPIAPNTPIVISPSCRPTPSPYHAETISKSSMLSPTLTCSPSTPLPQTTTDNHIS